ncbi:MAG: hypothetical protein ABI024_14495 [Vicinamibacterales bacterium]
MPLIVTVDSLGGSCGICGDGFYGSGDYIDGQEGVKATIDQWGDIIIDFQTTQTKIRRLQYHYPPTTPVPPADGSHDYFSTLPLGNGALQAMGIRAWVFVASCPLYTDPSGQPQYRHGFYRDCGSGLGAEGSRLVVTRTASNQWTVEPELGSSARVFSTTTKGRTQVVDYGLMSLPFKMTLTAKQ